MLMPKRVKYRKQQRGRMNGKAYRGSAVTFGETNGTDNGTTITATGTYGTLGRNVLRGPRFGNTDLSIARAFPLGFREGLRVLFRSEFFNLFNHPNLGLPAATIGNSNFGQITSTDGAPRILQLSLKVEF